MGTRMVKQPFCDACGRTVGVKRYTIATTDRAMNHRGDLCRECSEPLRELAKKFPAVKRGRPQKPVLTEAQVRKIAAENRRQK